MQILINFITSITATRMLFPIRVFFTKSRRGRGDERQKIRRKEKDMDRSSSVEQISIRRGIMKFHPVQRSNNERINPLITIVSNFFHLVEKCT